MQTKPPNLTVPSAADVARFVAEMQRAIQQQAAQLAYQPNRHERRAAKHTRKRGKP